jgi:hypothetical protein
MWPTPTLAHAARGNHDEPLEEYQARVKDYYDKKAKGKPGKSLGIAVRMWPTPRASNPGSRPNGRGGKILQEEVQIAEGIRKRGQKMWPTPTARDHKDTGPNLNYEKISKKGRLAGRVMWPTPRAAIGMGMRLTENMAKLRHKKYLETEVAYQESAPGGSLNPTWVEWLMGYPSGWTDLNV